MQTQIPASAEQARQQQRQPDYEPESSQLLRTPNAWFQDNRPEATTQLHLQSLMARSAQATQLKSVQAMMAAKSNSSALKARGNQRMGVMQLVEKQGPDDQGMIDVEEVDDYLPNCLPDVESRKFYRRSSGITSGWNDQDLFYADGALIQVTVAMVDAYWDEKYEGFAKLSGPDWIKNCEDYAKADGFGAEAGSYTSTETLSPLIQDNGSYVLNLGFHWMRVIKTGADAITIKQKDGESSVYSKNFNLVDALNYIIEKRGFGGTVYGG